MARWGHGLRARSMLALGLACLLALLPAGLIAWKVVDSVRDHFGEAYARNFTQLNRQNIVAPVSRELALSKRLADSVVSRQWLLDEADPAKRALFFQEAEGYRQDFGARSYFLISAISRNYYFNDGSEAPSDQPRYQLNPDAPNDAWFFNSIADTEHYNINVNPDVKLHTTRVWLNVVVRDGERKIGLAGTVLDLGGFLDAFISTREPGVTPMILDASGAIQAHPDERLIAFGSTTGAAARAHTLADLLKDEPERQALRGAMARSIAAPGEVATIRATLDGREQLVAVSYVPELRWHVVTAVDLGAANVLDGKWAAMAIAALVVLLLILLAAFSYAVDRLVLKPLARLHQSATAMSQGRFDVALPTPRDDEIGDLGRAFGTMADTIKSHTEELESRVRERTAALEDANREMTAAQRQISDSIDYASLIQRAILPDRQMSDVLGQRHFVLWRPRDVVGGDFYVFRADGEKCLIGVFDCAGHGVPGALMTMLARAAIDHAIARAGMDSPAEILAAIDAGMRAMLQDFALPRAIATNMDAGIACVDRHTGKLRYAGAKIPLYWSNGEDFGEIRGGRRALGDRRIGHYEDTELAAVPGRTYYMATDGYLDQAGGERGYGFGNSRFAEVLRAHAALPMDEQARALDAALERYRGEFPQRDDITILSFRLD